MKPAIIRRLLPNWGTTYGPNADGPFPAVMLLHGSEGGYSGWMHRTAAMFAANGFLCYPHSYSKGCNSWNAGHIENVEISQTAEALIALRHFAPSNGKVAVYGLSRGAEHALLLAGLMAQNGLDGLPEAVACHAAPDVICGAFDAKTYRDKGDPGWQVWDPSRRAWTWNDNSDNLLPTSPIAMEHYKGPLFLSTGTNDKVWSPKMTRRLEARRKTANLPVEAHYYQGEDHVPTSEAENKHHELLMSFFASHICDR